MLDPRFRNDLPKAEYVFEYFKGYSDRLKAALNEVSQKDIEQAFQVLLKASQNNACVFVAGNGGSAAIADHLCCDWLKGTHVQHLPAITVHSLVSNTALLTSLANDFGYEASFSKQLEMIGKSGDVVVLISSSGNSNNILAAARSARLKSMSIIGFVGFDGGKLKGLCDVCLHVPANNYGIVEDTHQILMHVFAQYLAKLRDKISSTRKEHATISQPHANLDVRSS